MGTQQSHILLPGSNFQKQLALCLFTKTLFTDGILAFKPSDFCFRTFQGQLFLLFKLLQIGRFMVKKRKLFTAGLFVIIFLNNIFNMKFQVFDFFHPFFGYEFLRLNFSPSFFCMIFVTNLISVGLLWYQFCM